HVVEIRNSIRAGNHGVDGYADCYGAGAPLTSDGWNILGSDEGCGLSSAPGDLVGSAAAPIDPTLGPAQDNGGGTFTMALLPGSPAIDTANPAAPGSDAAACEALDARGVSRPQDTACDKGAYEEHGSIRGAVTGATGPVASALVALVDA